MYKSECACAGWETVAGCDSFVLTLDECWQINLCRVFACVDVVAVLHFIHHIIHLTACERQTQTVNVRLDSKNNVKSEMHASAL